jgi:2-epi-5-epi-valiolone synthase
MQTGSQRYVRKLDQHGWEVRSTQSVRYSVRFYDGLFSHTNTVLLREGIGQTPSCQRRLIVIDTRILDLYGWEIEAYFRANRVQYRLLPFQTTETEKTVENVLRVVRALNEFWVNRRSDPLIAIGGGVLLDVAGFAASLYRRGLPYIRVPTTLFRAEVAKEFGAVRASIERTKVWMLGTGISTVLSVAAIVWKLH